MGVAVMSYDQWEVASPYDDDFYAQDEAEKFIKRYETDDDENIQWARAIMAELLRYLEEAEQ